MIKRSITGEPLTNRWHLLFIFLSIAVFFLLPLLSRQAGISGDEPVHQAQAALVSRYFKTGGTDKSALETPKTHLKYYGQAFDNLCYRLSTNFPGIDPYRIRHFVNSLIGAATLLFCGLLAIELAGMRAGILALLLLFFSPRFIGHSFNNLKDIPFAFGYLVTLYSLVRWTKFFPTIRWQPMVVLATAIGFTLAVRPGGLFLFPVLFFFTALQAVIKRPETTWRHSRNLIFYAKLFVLTILILSLAFFLGIADWPYALQRPFSHPFQALTAMTHFKVSIRQLFEGRIFWSENLPWYYPLKYLFITAPLIVLTGWILNLVILRKKSAVVIGLLFFMTLFPLFWVIVKRSNLYDGFRHLLFIYPVICALSGATWSELIRKFKKPVIGWSIILLIAAGITGPFIFMIRNHPMEYTYFNQLAGGFNKAYGRYETDYYYHSMGQAVHWLENEVLDKQPDSAITLASNFPLEPYLPHASYSGQLVYTGWYERTRIDWDYGIFVNSFISPYQLQHHDWPPVTVLHEVSINGLPVCVVLKRGGKQSLHCRDLYLAKQYNEAERCYSKVVETDPADEMSLLYLGWTFNYLANYPASNRIAGRILVMHPESEPALVLQATNLLYQGQFQGSLSVGQKALHLNPKYAPAQKIVKQALDSLN